MLHVLDRSLLLTHTDTVVTSVWQYWKYFTVDLVRTYVIWLMGWPAGCVAVHRALVCRSYAVAYVCVVNEPSSVYTLYKHS